MSGKPTPGPWEVWTSCSWRRICRPDGTPVLTPTIQRVDNHPDLEFANGGFDGPDAHLVCAAPDLLAALEALVDAQYAQSYDLADPDWRPAWMAAYAAIKKARGET